MNMTKLIGTFTLMAATAMPLQSHAQDHPDARHAPGMRGDSVSCNGEPAK